MAWLFKKEGAWTTASRTILKLFFGVYFIFIPCLDAARTVELERTAGATGVPAPVIHNNQDEFESDYQKSLNNWIIKRNPHLQAYINSDPMAAKVSNDDWDNLLQLFVVVLSFLLVGVALVFTWKRFGKLHWLRLPPHMRTGLVRLYVAVTVPWVAWFGYQVYEAYYSRYWSARAFWSLLIVPIGGPILLSVILWVLDGFNKSARDKQADKALNLKADKTAVFPNCRSQRSTADYYSIIANAVTKLPDNTPETRRALYDRARMALATQLYGQDPSQLAHDQRCLERAIRRMEAVSYRPVRGKREIYEPASTALLVVLMFSHGWLIDFTCMSLYWVARLPKVRT
jgi:hypothetical protein